MATGGVYFWHSATDAVEWQAPQGGTPRDQEPIAGNAAEIEENVDTQQVPGGASHLASTDEAADAADTTARQAAQEAVLQPVAGVTHDNDSSQCGTAELEEAGIAQDVAAWTESLLVYLR
jgi:hypothetical protein